MNTAKIHSNPSFNLQHPVFVPEDTRKPKKLVAAMSGGVDSSVAAWLMKNEGIEVIGTTLILRDCDDEADKAKSCCSAEDQIQVKQAAATIGIPHYFLDFKEAYRTYVLKNAWTEYEHGRTPNPCVHCNRVLKFGMLMEYAKSIGADGIITGHYARLWVEEDGNPNLLRGDDPKKDQTYFLFDIEAPNLAASYFPLGYFTKPEVRKLAEDLKLPNAQKTESQDACFGIQGESFSDTLKRLFDGETRKGNILLPDGTILGKHNGLHQFTIGQRKGLGIALGVPAYVSSIDFDSGNVTVTSNEALIMQKTVKAVGVNWIKPEYSKAPFTGTAQIRYGHKGSSGKLIPGTANRDGKVHEMIIEFDEPQRAVTPGQGLVVYDGDKLVAGGWIVK